MLRVPASLARLKSAPPPKRPALSRADFLYCGFGVFKGESVILRGLRFLKNDESLTLFLQGRK